MMYKYFLPRSIMCFYLNDRFLCKRFSIWKMHKLLLIFDFVSLAFGITLLQLFQNEWYGVYHLCFLLYILVFFFKFYLWTFNSFWIYLVVWDSCVLSLFLQWLRCFIEFFSYYVLSITLLKIKWVCFNSSEFSMPFHWSLCEFCSNTIK